MAGIHEHICGGGWPFLLKDPTVFVENLLYTYIFTYIYSFRAKEILSLLKSLEALNRCVQERHHADDFLVR